jgi:uncharacterized protein (DUF924 family)
MIDIWSAAAVMAGPRAGAAEDWRAVYDFWFAPGLDDADLDTLRRRVEWWMGGGANAALPPFTPVLAAARAGRLEHWAATPLGRLSLIVVLDQFPRGLSAGTPDAYASDPEALRIAEDGLRNGHHAALARPWERMFSVLPLSHTEGAGHLERLDFVVALAEKIAREVPEHLRPLYEFSVSQARGHRDVIRRFGRYPHRNPVLGRASTPEEEAYLAKGDFVHQRRMPAG